MVLGWVASVAVILAGVGLILYGHYEAAVAWVFLGITVLALGVTVGAVSGGVRHPAAIIGIFFGVELALVLIDFLDFGGLKGVPLEVAVPSFLGACLGGLG